MAGSYPPLHIAPLPSVDSSDVSLLDDYDNSKPQARVSYGGRRRISSAVIVPGILIFIAVAGLASALLVWLQSRRVVSHISREDPYFDNAIVAIEGTRAPHRLDDGSLESDTTMYGLAMSTVSVQLVSLTVPFLLGLLGYRLASMWILAQEKERLGSMPTAAQYGLLVKLCGSANLFSAYETVRYLKRGRKRRSQAPSSLIFAFAILVLAIVLNHLLSAADLWLHTTTSTFIHTSMTPIAMEFLPNMGTKINLTMCPGPLLNSPDGYGNCGLPNTEIVVEGLDVMRNSSSTSRTVMVDDIAVLVPTTMPDNVYNLTFGSFGLIAHCQPVVDCSFNTSMEYTFYCPFNPPYNIRVQDLLTAGTGGWIEIFNLTDNTVSLDESGKYRLGSVLNPYGACLALYWTDTSPEVNSDSIFPTDTLPGWYQDSDDIFHGYMSTCNMTAYNVSLSYSSLDGNNTYNFTDRPIPSNFNTTSALFAALDPDYGMNLVDYLKTTLATSLTYSTETFYAALSRNMSYAAMSLASPLFERDMSTGGNAILLRSASRYPLAPLSAVLAILYTYAFLALAITVSSVMLLSREIVVAKNGGKEHRATAIELVQLRLTNPLASIAERFVDPARPELLLETSAVDMFHEHPHADKLGVVMADGEGEGGEGIVRRRRTLRVESVERSLTRLSGSILNISET